MKAISYFFGTFQGIVLALHIPSDRKNHRHPLEHACLMLPIQQPKIHDLCHPLFYRPMWP